VRPIDVAIEQTLAFLRRVLPRPPLRVLDAGCGRGDLAARLTASGFEVTALDSSPQAVRHARALGVPAIHVDFLEYEAAPYDAVLFSRSLHHMHPLPGAVARAFTLLKPGGRLVAEEFARERADRQTAAWFYDVRALLRDAGVLEIAKERGRGTNPLDRWRADHVEKHGHPLHTSGAMLAEIAHRLEVTDTEDAPYLYWYLTRWIEESPRGCAVSDRLLEIETRRITTGLLAPMGVRIIARRRVA